MEERYAQAEAMAICKALYDKKAQDIRAMYVQEGQNGSSRLVHPVQRPQRTSGQNALR